MSLSSAPEARAAAARPRLAAVPGWVWLAGPYMLVLLLALLVPLANLGNLSVLRYDPQSIWTPDLTLENYDRLLDSHYFDVLVRTLRIGVITTLACLLIGAPLAYWLARCSRSMLALGLFFVVMPMMVSTVIRAFGWMVLLGRNGVLNGTAVSLGFDRWVFIMNTEAAVILALVQICLPLMVLPAMAAIEKIPRALEEAATNLGAGPVQLARQVLIPLAAPGLASGALLCFVIAISVVVTPALMGGRSNRMIGNEIYDQVITALNWPFASAMAATLIVVVVGILLLSGAAARWLAPRTEG
jgi:ABC-type spermidine/putrescine transport system permease subunit I